MVSRDIILILREVLIHSTLLRMLNIWERNRGVFQMDGMRLLTFPTMLIIKE